MRSIAALGLLSVALATGCGGGSASPESVVRAWSEALNAGDNEGAAEFFAEGARVVQYGRVSLLRTRAEAIRWNAGLPCSGRIVSITEGKSTVRATFLLRDGPARRCDGPGARATAFFRIREGKIVLWHQLGTQRPDSQDA